MTLFEFIVEGSRRMQRLWERKYFWLNKKEYNWRYSGQLSGFTVLVPDQEALITFTAQYGNRRGFSAVVNYYYHG